MKKWTGTEDKVLRDCANSLTAAQIGDLIGRTEKAVISHAGVLKVKLRKSGDKHHNRKYSVKDIELAHLLQADGMPFRLIAEKLEIPFASLKNHLC